MGIFVDLLIVLIIGLCVFYGYKKGLARCILKLVTSIIALFIAILLFRPFVNFVVDNTIIDENIQLSLEKVMNNGIEERKDENNTELVKEDSGIPKPIAEYLNDNLKNSAKQKQEEAVVSVARSAAILIVQIACFILIYVVMKIILKILSILIDIVSKLPIIRQFNEIGGCIYGIVEGVVIVLLIMTGVAIITPLTGAYEVATIILQSHLGVIFYNNNIILNLIF